MRTRVLLSWLLLLLLTLGQGHVEAAFFDTSEDSGHLTIRYFNLVVENKEELQRHTDRTIKPGDAILVTTPDGRQILIDSGLTYVGDQLLKFLQQLGVDRLDYAFATHPHWDHIGGFLTLFPNIPIGKMYHVNVPNDTDTLRLFLQGLDDYAIPNRFLEAGDQLMLGDYVSASVLNPPAGTSPDTLESPENISTARINNLSLVMRLDYGETSALFTGDIYRAQERYLSAEYPEEMRANVLHAPHHGEETGSSFELIEAVMPEVTIISRDDLASIAIFNRYRAYDSDVYVTGMNGHILIRLDGESVQVVVEQEIDSPFLH